MICACCGLVSHEEIPTDQELADYYARRYRWEYHGEYLPKPHRVVRAWRGGRWLLQTLRPHLNAGQRVLEIGAGIGCTVKVFERAGFCASGIEPGEGFQAYAVNRLHADVQRAWLSELPRFPAYDVVLLVHVIEHFRSPRHALLHIRDLLSDQGQLYVECPNVAAPHAAPGKLFHLAHVHNFALPTLVSLAQSCGFRLVKRLAGEKDRSLRCLFRRAHPLPVTVWPDQAQRTLQQIFRYNWLTYHLRPSYYWQRLMRDAKFLSDHFLPGLRVRRIVRAVGGSSYPLSRTKKRITRSATRPL